MFSNRCAFLVHRLNHSATTTAVFIIYFDLLNSGSVFLPEVTFGFHAIGAFGVGTLLIKIKTVMGLVLVLFVKLNTSKGKLINHLLGAVILGYDKGMCSSKELPRHTVGTLQDTSKCSLCFRAVFPVLRTNMKHLLPFRIKGMQGCSLLGKGIT